MKQREISTNAIRAMIGGLKSYISRLDVGSDASVWDDYSETHSYSEHSYDQKKQIVASFCGEVGARSVLDLGTNSGDFLVACLDHGAESGIGVDFDLGALHRLVLRARREKRNVLPLLIDAANPSPSQGWAGLERSDFQTRCQSDLVLCLGCIHHLAIARNVPLPEILDWLLSLGPHGVIEFVPKSDPMVQTLLANRTDVFARYTIDDFEQLLLSRVSHFDRNELVGSERVLYSYRVGGGSSAST